ncbi:MAG: methionine biosynthesis protein MetW [Anaeromyxobacteraceae bacterium]
MTVVGALHERVVFGRRVRALSRAIADLIPPNARVLDVGCGDGSIDGLIQQSRPDVAIQGVDVLVRPGTKIPVQKFDGEVLPFEDAAFDVVMFVDVLHHTNSPEKLLAEACRVSRGCLVIKDHTNDPPLGNVRLRFMDWVGNAHHGVVLPYNYMSAATWSSAWEKLGLHVSAYQTQVGLYPFPADLIFERGLHFVSRLEKEARPLAAPG